MAQKRIAIIGGGPGGLSLARLLKDRGQTNVTVYEASSRPGGKSDSHYYGAAVAEMGTCYTTLYDGLTKSWMKEFGIGLIQNGVAKYDDAEFMDYVRKGGGPPFALQALKFLLGGAWLKFRLAQRKPSPRAIAEAATPIRDWMASRRLPKMELFLHRVQTAMGYGFVHDTSAVQAHRWCTLRIFLTGALNQMHKPDKGWAALWKGLASQLDVRLNTPVIRVERMTNEVRLYTKNGVETFDELVCTIPLDQFCSLVDNPSENEKFVANSVDWQGYATTLIASDNWFTDVHINAWSDAVKANAPLGQVIGGRMEEYAPDLGGQIYMIGQLSAGLTSDELMETMRETLKRKSVNLNNVIEHRNWQFFPQYRCAAVADGLLGVMKDMQGENLTWFTGSTFSFEAVGFIVNFNKRLAKRIQRNDAEPAETTPADDNKNSDVHTNEAAA